MKGRIIYLLATFMLIFNNYIKSQSCGVPDVLLFGTIQTSTSASPYWTAVPGAVSYNVEYRIRNIGAQYSAPISTSNTSITLTGLSPSTNYEFIVQSVCASDTSAYSMSGWFTTWADPATISVSRGPYLTVSKSTSITIEWKTNSVCNSEVRYGTSPNNLDKLINNPSSSTYHSVVLNNLTPNTKYYYSVGTIGTVLEATAQNYFYTAPEDNAPDPLRFWVTGDFGTGSSGQAAVRDAFINHTAGTKVDGWLWLGDNAYSNGAESEYQSKVFDKYTSILKNIPIFPALGNHDYAQSGYQSPASLGTNFPYFSLFSIPTNSGTKKYYSTNYGNVHFIALDSYGSYNSFTSDMFQWLENDLSNNTQQWTIVYFHHPPYTKGSHDSDNEAELIDMRNNIIPLLESNGVDLVLSGHSHAYERSNFIKGHFGVESTFTPAHIVQPGPGPYTKASRIADGTIYAVCGVSGQIEGTESGYPHDAMYYSNASNYGSLILDITGTSLSGKFLTSTGAILDNFTITKPDGAAASTPEISGTPKLNFDVFPNPAHNEFNISMHTDSDREYLMKIYSVTGQVVYEKIFETSSISNEFKIGKNEIEKCTPGIYYISISDENDKMTKSVVLF